MVRIIQKKPSLKERIIDWIKYLDYEKILWRIICILFLIFVFNTKIVHLSWDQADKILSYKRDHYTNELTEYELDDFIRLYPKFQKDGISKRIDVDYLMIYPDSADWMTKRWFIYQAWDIDRFFYIKKRTQEAMEIIKARKEAAGFAKQFSDQINKENEIEEQKKKNNKYKPVSDNTEDKKYDITRQMLEVHQKRAEDMGDFSPEELELVEKKWQILTELFN